MISAIVVDDEPLARALVESHIRKTPFIELVGSYADAIQALEAIRKGDIDVAFLDIQMPDMNGLELSRIIDRTSTKIVFITAFDKYAVHGFRVDAVDYLLKPVTFADFFKSAERVRDRIEMEKAAKAEPSPSPAQQTETPKPKSMFVKSEYKMQQVAFEDILFIEGAKDYIIIRMEDGQMLMTQMTMKNMEILLPQEEFMRVHKSYIVNLKRVKVIEHNCVIFGNKLIPVSESYKDKFYLALGM